MQLKRTGFILGILSFILFCFFIDLSDSNPNISRMAAVASLMAIWWITEPVPLAVTSLIPIVLFPVTGIEKGDVTAATYINSTIFLFFGGFLLALAMEKWNLHKRMALKIILLFGGSQHRIIMGFMVATAFLSMWISNTATAVMMLPLAMSIVGQLEEMFDKDSVRNFSTSLMLGVAYSCSIGGIATIIGTPPNLSFLRIFHIIFPSGPDISFGIWLVMIMPLSVVLLSFTWFLLCRILFKAEKNIIISDNVIRVEYQKLGVIKREEKIIGFIFIITAVLWMFRSDLEIGIITIPGWSNFLNYPDYINDGTIAIFMGILLFILPSAERGKILDASVLTKIPWDIILLFGGGFALAKGFVVSGLSEFIGTGFSGLSFLHPFLIMLLAGTVITFLTELTSNTATAEMILPILASISVAIGLNPLLLMLNGTLSASMAFMLPVATPPNAVVFGSQRVQMRDMVKAGLLLNIAGIITITVTVYFYAVYILNIDLSQMPQWALTR